MPAAQDPQAVSRPRTSGGRGAWWIARWLLVLVLAFDHLSAPFHQHHHDGVEGPLELAAAHPSFDDGDAHAESDEHGSGSHGAVAIRIDPLRLGQLPGLDDADAQVVLISVVGSLAAREEPPAVHRRPGRAQSGFCSHRSLPPASRAPPLHA
jgi:hypothetical protein